MMRMLGGNSERAITTNLCCLMLQQSWHHRRYVVVVVVDEQQLDCMKHACEQHMVSSTRADHGTCMNSYHAAADTMTSLSLKTMS